MSRLIATVTAVSSYGPSLVPCAVTMRGVAKGPPANRSWKASRKLAADVSTAVDSGPVSMARPAGPSIETSSAVPADSQRRTRRPNAAARRVSIGAIIASIGVMRCAAPKSCRTPFSSCAPSPKSHDEAAREGNVGVEVTIGGPAAGSVRVPALVGWATRPPA